MISKIGIRVALLTVKTLSYYYSKQFKSYSMMRNLFSQLLRRKDDTVIHCTVDTWVSSLACCFGGCKCSGPFNYAIVVKLMVTLRNYSQTPPYSPSLLVPSLTFLCREVDAVHQKKGILVYKHENFCVFKPPPRKNHVHS